MNEVSTRDSDRYHFLKPIPIFKKKLTNICPVAYIRLAIDTDIPKFTYQYFCRYFNKVFWLKLVVTTYSPDYGSFTNEVD